MNRSRKKLFVVLILVLSAAIIPFSANAIQKNNLPYDSYSTWKGQGATRFVVQKAVYLPLFRRTGIELGIEAMEFPENLAATEDTLFILDSGKSRIILLDEDFNVKKVIGKLNYQGQELSYEKAKGIYVNAQGKIYIADTEGKRILISDQEGIVERIITAPKSEIIPDDMLFEPIEIAEDDDGYLFVLGKGCYYGAYIFDKEGNFQGFFGASRVGGSVLTIFRRLIDNLIGTDARREGTKRKLPFEYSDICYSEGFFYTASETTSTNAGQIKKLGFSGENILTTESGQAEYYTFGDRKWVYMDADGTYLTNRFTSVEVSKDGFIYALDEAFCKIFVYDSECNLITVFGGGFSAGSQLGTFQNPCDMALFDDKLIVLDRENGSVTAFERTEYGNLLYQAIALTRQGNYETAKPVWMKVNEMDSFNQLAYRGLANAYLIEGDYNQALDYARKGYDRKLYERAFEEVRRKFISENFILIFAVIILVLTGLISFVIYTNRHKDKVLIKNSKLRTFLRILIHPIDSFYDIKYNTKGSIAIAGSVMLLYFVFTVLSVTSGGFMYVSYDPMKYNSGLTFLGTTGVALLWCMVNYGACTLFEGKGKFREIFIVTGYALLPQLIYLILFIPASYVLVYSESAILSVLSTISWIYTAAILLAGTSVIHEYGMLKAVGMAVVTILGMALVAFVIVLILTLFQDLFLFAGGVMRELIYRSRG